MSSSRVDEFNRLGGQAFKDYDPEDEPPAYDDDESDSSAASRGKGNGRDHYEKVGSSKLRRQQAAAAALGEQYRGSRISRNGLATDEAEHDPFEGHDEDESLSEAEGADSDSDGPSVLGEPDDSLADEDMSMDGEEKDGFGEDDSDAGTEDTSLDDAEAGEPAQSAAERAELRALMNDSGKTVAATIAAATAADAAKGRGVKAQRRAFDSLLNTRIRLQHALIASNSMSAVSATASDVVDDKAYEGAEAAAMNLFNTLSILRDSLPSQGAGSKRKRSLAAANETSNSALWESLSEQDASCQANERAILQKWSRKTASATTTTIRPTNKLVPVEQTTLLDILDSHLAPNNMDRHLERTKLPRSCAPIQQQRPRASRGVKPGTAKVTAEVGNAGEGEDEGGAVYDDADFYGILLKELLEARNSNATVDYAAAAANAASASGSVEDQYRAARAAKSHARPGADRKASKGRRLRYTVHERLQNWMAPEAERATWPARQRDELFGSLFGRRAQLDEGDEGGERQDGVSAEEEALMLFRS